MVTITPCHSYYLFFKGWHLLGVDLLFIIFQYTQVNKTQNKTNEDALSMIRNSDPWSGKQLWQPLHNADI